MLSRREDGWWAPTADVEREVVLRGRRGHRLDEDPALRGANLVVELAQEVQADQAIDVVVAEVEHVKPEARQDEPERGETSHGKHVALLAADRRADVRSP